MALAGQFLSKGFGIVNEEAFPYINKYMENNLDLNIKTYMEDIDGKNVAHISDMYIADIHKDNGSKIVKEALMKNGSASLSYYSNDFYYNLNTGAYFTGTEKKSSSHMVALVGWDDNFPASAFKMNPGQDGAWLVRNSWGGYNDDLSYNMTEKDIWAMKSRIPEPLSEENLIIKR